jgi:drug/metabolite transporter (DMT)-like permease
MTIVLMTIVAGLLLTAAAYVHVRIPRHTQGATKRAVLRSVLFVIGAAFGYVAATHYAEPGGPLSLLAFLSGFGLVHVPAAFILLIKHERGEGKS